eukprot:CAMPEP_0201232804 /NCGR_PEP_ID=MMETSP0852-20130820/4666_1 /ASSEMBLY_ACC=CAM_ASM_000632 /TAXON_ID=183588 /ORGANISM="Pseudo-nitzschia fraudulenta, Strain WWA7" /LENGTH=64 /DNA_ID=CAMNT_0047525397 /DNA_START=185 /DNA_END=376 /DNA_ORIENTATION=-
MTMDLLQRLPSDIRVSHRRRLEEAESTSASSQHSSNSSSDGSGNTNKSNSNSNNEPLLTKGERV